MSRTPVPSRTSTLTPTKTRTPTRTATATKTNTPSRSRTPTKTATRITQTKTYTKTVVVQTLTPNLTKTATPTPTRTSTLTYTPSRTGTVTQTRTPTATATYTRTATATPTPILGASSNPNLAGMAWKFYYLAGSERVAMRMIDGGSNQLYYLFSDHLGSTSEARGADGSLHNRQYYRAFGEERYTSGALPTDRTYTGQREIEFGLVHYGARIYDPALGRFAQADAVIPEPWKPVTWDRFSYALSNPIKNNDPTGHCSGDANDPNNPDIACWNVYNDLKNTYKSVNVDVTFDYAFLLMIRQSLDLVFNAFGNMVAFEKALGNFSIIYSPSIDRAVTPPGLRTIFLGDSSIVQGQNLASDAIQVIIHEIGHIFDFGKPDIDSPYKSQLFIDIFNSGSCSSGTLGCLGNGASSLYKTINYLSGGGTNGYNPSGIPSAYGKTSSIDDFSESFTGYILRFNGLSSVTIPLDQKRDMIIATYIDLAVR